MSTSTGLTGMDMNASATDGKLAARTQKDPRWTAVVARDSRAAGKFFYAVRTTGIYCRPSCGSRRARPENVRFYATATDAARAGFRPCKRCKPDQPALDPQHAATVAKMFRGVRDT